MQHELPGSIAGLTRRVPGTPSELVPTAPGCGRDESRVRAACDRDGPRARVELALESLDLDAVVARSTEQRRLPRVPGACGWALAPAREAAWLWTAPRVRRPDRSCAGDVPSTAIEAIDGWWESPRHAALIEYTTRAPRRCPVSGRWHVTVAQAYDWMWRHYRYTPPDGRTRSRTRSVGPSRTARCARPSVAARVGIAILAYGSVYGAEPEYVDRHPDDRVFDATGEPLSLGGTFFINDLRPGSAWRRRLLAEYGRAMRALPLRGHPHGHLWSAVDRSGASDGRSRRSGSCTPDSSRRPPDASARSGWARVLFNCVEGFPLEDVAPAPMAALYLELWPPDDRYRHVVDWIDRARAVANGRAVDHRGVRGRAADRSRPGRARPGHRGIPPADQRHRRRWAPTTTRSPRATGC